MKKTSNYGLFLGGAPTVDINRSKSEGPQKSSVGGGTIDSNEGKDSNFARDRSNPNRAIFLQEEKQSIKSGLNAEQQQPQRNQQQTVPNILENKNQYISSKKRQEIEEL